MDISDISTDKLIELLEDHTFLIDEMVARLAKSEEDNDNLKAELEEILQGQK